jgi:cysteinyl-tRNA synthetase
VDFEIHGGGSDLVFPHHENEIAQTEAARGQPLARLWMHNGMVEMADEKMAKSVGNIRLLHGAIEQFGREAFLMWMVGAHYRKPVAYTEDTLADAGRAVDRVRELIRRLDAGGDSAPELDAIVERFFDHLADDFNTAAARAELFAWLAEANRRIDAGERLGPGRLGEMLHAFGLERLLEGDSESAPEDVERLAAERQEARDARDFERADRLRDELAARGWEIRDTAEGPRLVRT